MAALCSIPLTYIKALQAGHPNEVVLNLIAHSLLHKNDTWPAIFIQQWIKLLRK